jgi:hypothetical protein
MDATGADETTSSQLLQELGSVRAAVDHFNATK